MSPFYIFVLCFYQGNYPFKKYIKIYPKLSISSRLLYSFPLWTLMEAYLAVPTRFLPEHGGMWELFSKYNLDKPKSIKNMVVWSNPNVKLDGFKSLWTIFLLWMYSNRSIIETANYNTVFRLKSLLFFIKISSREGPKSSISIKL